MEQDTTNWFYLIMTWTSSSGTRTQILLCIQNLRATSVAVWLTERKCPWLFMGSKNWILAAPRNTNWSELMICPLWFLGRNGLRRHKGMALERILFTKTTIQKKLVILVSAVRVTEPNQPTFIISFWHTRFKKGNLTVEYCPTTEIIADFMIKPLQGKLFQKFRKMIMSHMNVLILYLERQNCVGQLNNRTTDSRQTPKRNTILYTHLGLIQLIIDCVR